MLFLSFKRKLGLFWHICQLLTAAIRNVNSNSIFRSSSRNSVCLYYIRYIIIEKYILSTIYTCIYYLYIMNIDSKNNALLFDTAKYQVDVLLETTENSS